MAEPAGVAAVVEEFLARQREMYAGGDLAAVEALLAEDVVWHVPGHSPLAGDHRGRAAVLDYFRLRRELAGGAIEITKVGETHHDEALVQLADGRARLAGADVEWRTAGVYRVAASRIAEAWLVPLDQEAFDRAWAAVRPAPFVSTRRIRPEDCGADGLLGHVRLLEHLEAAARERLGARDLAVQEVELRLLSPIRAGDELRIEVALDRVTERAVKAHFGAFAGATRVAEAGARYARPEEPPTGGAAGRARARR